MRSSVVQVPRVNCKFLVHTLRGRQKILIKINFLDFPPRNIHILFLCSYSYFDKDYLSRFSASEYSHFVLMFIDSLNHSQFFNHYSNTTLMKLSIGLLQRRIQKRTNYLSYDNGIGTHNHSVRKRTLKWLHG